MKNPTEEFIMLRMSEPLEEELRKEKKFKKQKDELWHAISNWNNMSKMTQKQLEDFEFIEDALSKYTQIYGEIVYRLGYSDGLQIGAEQNVLEKETFLSLKDMSNLISIYDAVKKLKITLLGTLDIYPENDSIMGLLNYVFDIINNGICAEIKLLGKDRAIELVTNILDRNSNTPKERAKQLLGIDKYSK